MSPGPRPINFQTPQAGQVRLWELGLHIENSDDESIFLIRYNRKRVECVLVPPEIHLNSPLNLPCPPPVPQPVHLPLTYILPQSSTLATHKKKKNGTEKNGTGKNVTGESITMFDVGKNGTHKYSHIIGFKYYGISYGFRTPRHHESTLTTYYSH